MRVRPTIFLSGVSSEFRSFRDAVENEIEMKGCFAENQPGFPPDYRTVEAMLRNKLHEADAVIHIVGFRFGAEPNQRSPEASRRSYTQIEFDLARAMGKPVYVFLARDASVRDTPAAAEQAEDAEAALLQLAHRDAVQTADHLYYVFKDQAELCKLVAEIPPVAAAGFNADISRIIRYAPERLIGREEEMALLTDAWAKVRARDPRRPRVLTFVALGGEGKTSLVAKWIADLAAQDWPGCDAVFAWSFYSQGTRDQAAVSSDLFLASALTFFGDAAMAGSAQGAFDKGRRLAQLVGERRALLVLDGLEPLQYAPTSPTPGELKDQGLAALLKGLAASNNGLCVVTTRYALPDLRAFLGKTVREEKLTRLSRAAGVQLLQAFGVKGSLRQDIPSPDGRERWNEFEKLVEDVKGHALTLNLLGSYLRDAHAGDIRKVGLVKLEEADVEEQGGHAFHVMDAYVRWLEGEAPSAGGQRALALLRLMGLFDRPATADCLEAVWRGEAIAGLTDPLVGLSDAQRNVTLKRLVDAKLLTVNRAAGSGELVALDAHPLLREYFARRVREQQAEAWRAAHRRLYEHLCASTHEGEQPTLEALQPLYQAVKHGCEAGLQQEALVKVYRHRIQRYREFYTSDKLGAFGSDLDAVACVFEVHWYRVSPSFTERQQAWLLNEAATRLRALGRLTEALEPMRASAEMDLEVRQWEGATISYVNLSELALTLGRVAEAVRDAEQAVACANEHGDPFWRMVSRAVNADALHQAGRLDAAMTGFRDAEALEAVRQECHVPLFAVNGFHYCDLLLGETECAAWRRVLHGSVVPPSWSFAERCRAVSKRATQTLRLASDNRWLLAAALDHLTLGCAALYEAILIGSSRASCGVLLQEAVAGLRRAGQQDRLPRGLLTRAWLRTLTGPRTGADSAQTDLDEAWDIAERGPMPLFLTDIHLHRARLFFREAAYPWQSPATDLAAARRLIEKHGYWRRKEELEDAEAAVLNRRPG